jgi:hypothetical protein
MLSPVEEHSGWQLDRLEGLLNIVGRQGFVSVVPVNLGWPQSDLQLDFDRCLFQDSDTLLAVEIGNYRVAAVDNLVPVQAYMEQVSELGNRPSEDIVLAKVAPTVVVG